MSSLVPRPDLLHRISSAIEQNPVTAILGPRQCGKTTLARSIAKARNAEFFDLENPQDWDRLKEPYTALSPLSGLIVLDEVQRRPELSNVLRVLADRSPSPAKFLILGSASPDLIRTSSESLAGRISFIYMSGFELWEVGSDQLRNLWFRGGFPRSFLAPDESASSAWRRDFITTFLERDIRAFGVQVPPPTLRRLWMMLAHYHGQTWNASEVGRSLGEAHNTVKRHLDILTGAFMVRQLQPWHENIAKRQVKAPKIFFRDTGILHEFLGLDSFSRLEGHPKLGASWEGFVLEHILHCTGDQQSYFWATHADAELDLLIFWRGQRIGIEVKYSDSPVMTRSMHRSFADLKLDQLFVVHPGDKSFPLSERGEAVSILHIRDRLLSI